MASSIAARALSLVVAIAASSALAHAGETLVVTFDEVDADGGVLRANPARGGDPVTQYLAKQGIEVVEHHPATLDLYVVIAAETEGGAVIAPSYPNVFQHMGANGPIGYTLRFKKPLTSFSFKRARLRAGPTGIIHPMWSIVAIDATGRKGGSAGEETIASYKTVPERKFTLTAPAGGVIAAVEINADNLSRAAFSSVVLDDFELTLAEPRASGR